MIKKAEVKELKINDRKGFCDGLGFLSNFYEVNIPIEGIMYPTVEHAFQAMKTLNVDERKKIAQCSTAGEAKRDGRKVKLRSDWESTKVNIMAELLVLKFMDSKLKQKLLDTGDTQLVEWNNWHDNFWGVCTCAGCQDKIGRNNLGKLLMKLRGVIGGIDE